MAKKSENGKRDPRASFVRLADKRVAKSIKAIQLVGNLGNRGTYAYEDKDVAKIFKTLEAELIAARAKFGGKGGKLAVFSLE